MVAGEAFRPALAAPDAYYSQFGYISGVGPDGFPDLRLRVSFDAKPVRELVSQSGMSVWGTNRPVVVVWIARERFKDMPQIWPPLLAGALGVGLGTWVLDPCRERGG